MYLTLILTVWSLFVGGFALSPSCGPDWQISGDMYCYRFSENRLSWSDANKECGKMDSVLLRTYNKGILSDIQPIINKTRDTRWWTGLNDQKEVGVWQWDQGSLTVFADMTSINWIYEPDDTTHLQNCGALNIQGSVSDERCDDKHRAICEYTPVPGAGCIQGWLNFSTGCYLFPAGMEDPWSLVTWSDAVHKCNSVLDGTSASSQKSHLLYIETTDELHYVRHVLPLVTLTPQLWWIGLTDMATEGKFVWIDGTAVNPNILIWAVEPNNLGGQEKCGAINRNESFGDLSCLNKESYICMKENDAAMSQPLPSLGCPVSWTRAGQYCYLIETHAKHTWADAGSVCSAYGANLIKVDSMDKRSWLESQNYIFESGLWFWTGLNNIQDKTWRWTDGTVANMALVKWNSEPNNYKGSEDCAVIAKSGTFNDIGCLLNAGFICELNTEDAPCPLGWISNNAGDQVNCYYISTTLGTRDEANSQCKTLTPMGDAFLLAINTHAELVFISKKLLSQKSNVTEWFTGLTDSGHEGFWVYDTTFNPAPAAGLIPWSQMPEFTDGDENCVAIIFGGQYMNTKCTDQRPYICEKRAHTTFGTSAGSRVFLSEFTVSSVFILATYFVVYALCLHYTLHLVYVLSPSGV